jgi:sugar (pentulose or hexulose) kinase
MVTEASIASTTQMLDSRSKSSYPKCWKIRDTAKFGETPPEHGEIIGTLRQSIADELGIAACPVVCVPSHDTACAVTAVPTQEKDFIFISSGTWSLIALKWLNRHKHECVR